MTSIIHEPITERQLRQPCSCGLNAHGIYKPKVCYEHSEHGAVCFFCWVCGAHRAPAEAAEAAGASYLDCEDRTYQNSLDSEDYVSRHERSTVLDIQCPYGLLSEVDAGGHQFAKDVVCGRDWCDYCGGKDGVQHQRRKARWYPKARQLRSIGYFTFTMPEHVRPRDTSALSKLGRQVTRFMKYHGFARGLRRWHWFGDCPEHGERCDLGCARPWHPHLNVLVGAGWLEQRQIDAVRKSWSRALGVDTAVIFYEYADKVPQMLHIVKYVLRPTFERWQWDVDMAHALHGFRNSSTWGVWDSEPVWDIPEGEADYASFTALENGFCPHCGEPLVWQNRVLSVGELLQLGFTELGAGYYERQHGPPGAVSHV